MKGFLCPLFLDLPQSPKDRFKQVLTREGRQGLTRERRQGLTREGRQGLTREGRQGLTREGRQGAETEEEPPREHWCSLGFGLRVLVWPQGIDVTVFELLTGLKPPKNEDVSLTSILLSREDRSLVTLRPRDAHRGPPEARLKEADLAQTCCALDPSLQNSSPDAQGQDTRFEVMALLCPPLPGKAINCFFLLHPKLSLEDSIQHQCTEARLTASLSLSPSIVRQSQENYRGCQAENV